MNVKRRAIKAAVEFFVFFMIGFVPFNVAGAAGEMTFSEEAVVVGKYTISADERTNQIILVTRTENFPFFDEMII